LEEVAVTRKLYRSGESEYLLNKQTSRLKDIRELFMDTGVGTEAYSVIEQGKVDILLQSSPTERRLIFEEAAGISKYKARKKEAQRKMERTQQNLLRVADIVEELEKRLRSVKLQAGKARNFLEYQTRLNELRASFSLAEYHRHSETIARLAREARTQDDRATELKTTIGRHETREVELNTELDRLGEEITEADNELVRAQSEVTTQQERVAAGQRRLEEQESLRERSAQRKAADCERLRDNEIELHRVQESAATLQKQTHELHEGIDQGNEKDRELAREVAQAQALLEDEKAGIIELLRKSAQTHNEIIRLNTHRESLVGQKGRLHTRDSQIRAELEGLFGQQTQMRGRLGEVEELIAAESAKLEEKKLEATRAGTLRQQLVDELAKAKEHRSALESRRELLLDLQQKRDGIGAGVRRILEAKEEADEGEDGLLVHSVVGTSGQATSGTPQATFDTRQPISGPLQATSGIRQPISGTLQTTAGARRATGSPRGVFSCVRGLVADIFEADVPHAHLIEAALGESDQHLVVEDGAGFLSNLATLGDLPGRVTALCMDRLPPVIEERVFADQPGFVARAVDLVAYGDDFRQLAYHLLGKTIVVETLEDAAALARDDVYGHRFVTLSAEVFEADGRVSLGPAGSRAGLISRKSELKDIDVQLGAMAEEIAKLGDQLNRTGAEVGHLERIQQELRTAIYECNTAKVEASASLQSIGESISRLSEEQPVIAREVELIEHQITEAHRQSEEGGASLEAIERENTAREEAVTRRREMIDEVVARRRQVQEELTELKVAAGKLTEKRAAAAETINGLRRQMHELQGAIEAASRDAEQCGARIDEARSTIRTGKERLEELSGTIETLEASGIELRGRREKLRLGLEELGEAVKSARTGLSSVEAGLHELEMSLAETKVRLDELTARVAGELNIDLAQRYKSYEHAEQDWEAVENQIAELRGKIERLGNVNLDAITELDELEERHTFLTGQRDDLEQSLQQLEKLIAKLDTESIERFRAAFTVIRDHFRTLFRKLFGGGRADIVLEDAEDPLECGIEILAQPPGKELLSISLMSGGEKTMTAIALLMSIFKSRPAPYAILDEVDAALDEANNDRFNMIIREFVADSQFIIITHAKRTMSVADELYGITMQEPGVSTRVSVKVAGTNVA
jgi:chromosome segregation protein